MSFKFRVLTILSTAILFFTHVVGASACATGMYETEIPDCLK